MSQQRIARRALLQSALTASAGATAFGAATSNPAGGSGILKASDSKAVAETTAGRVRGYIRNGIFTFKGIPYAAPTSGTARFMPPTKPAPWSSVRSCLSYG